MEHIVIGLAWPYANGSLHLGHAAAFIGGDVLARYHRLRGDHVLLVSGSDCYGTPIAVAAAERGIPPNEIADRYHEEFVRTLKDGLGISYDLYTRTTTDQHVRVVQALFLTLLEHGWLYRKTAPALYSPLLHRFLPDRFVEGTCPHCGYASARGDQCDGCGALLDPLELTDPKVNPKILERGGVRPGQDELRLEVRQTEHFYLRLSGLQEKLESWVQKTSGSWRTNARSVAQAFLRQGLRDRAITRDTDWGVPVPVSGFEDKRIYVWFEAVTGYLSASQLWAEQQGDPELWKRWWCNDSSIHYYVHGKDNIPFHTIIWPAILLAHGDLHTPDRIIATEYLTLEGEKFSKSRNWAVWLPDYLASFDPEALRYFLIANGPESSDADFAWNEFARRVNGELIGTFGNLVNRTLTIAEKRLGGEVRFPSEPDDDSRALIARTREAFESVGALIEGGKFRAALRGILELAEHGNRYIDKKEPWRKLKDPARVREAEGDIAILSHVIKNLAVLVTPFLPRAGEQILLFLDVCSEPISWQYQDPADVQVVHGVWPLFRIVTPEAVQAQREKLGVTNVETVP